MERSLDTNQQKEQLLIVTPERLRIIVSGAGQGYTSPHKSPNEKEKCLEKLNQMQKFIPFIDLMIDKIKKKNNEISLECQLSKFEVLRSIISEKNGKHSWDVIVKVEEVIEKLITKLHFKEPYENSKENLSIVDSENCKTSMATSVSIVPSSTGSVSTSSSQTTVVDAEPKNSSPSQVELIMTTLKMSVENTANKSTDGDIHFLPSPLGTKPLDISEKTMETDLDKDLDGFDLTDCPNLSETDSNNTAAETPVSEVPGKVSSHDDLLSSSREKLLKSLQGRLYPCRTTRPSSQFPAGDKTSEPQIASAFSLSLINLGEPKARSDFMEISDQSAVEKNRKPYETSLKSGKHIPVILRTTKPLGFPDKIRAESNCSSDVNLKQKLKEKLSTDICEVYRVPGKSVGGSLRSLKESKDHRKSLNSEEEELFKPDKMYEKVSSKHSILQSRPSLQRKENQADKAHRDPSVSEKKGEKNNDKASHKHASGNSEKSSSRDGKRVDSQNSKASKNDSKSKGHKSEPGKGDKALDKKSDGRSTKDVKKSSMRKTGSKSFELDKLNDDELLDFVKENMQSLPHLARLKSSELRKAVQSSLSNVLPDGDGVSEISDTSLEDLEDLDVFVAGGNRDQMKRKTATEAPKEKSENKEPPHPFACVKIAQVGPDGVAKNVKPIVEPSKDTVVLEEVGDKTCDMDAVPVEETPEEEEDYALKLIEETTPKTYPSKKKKGLLELPMPVMDDLFDDISSIESFEPSLSPNGSEELVPAKASEGKTKSGNSVKSELTPLTSPSVKEAWPCLSGRPAANPPKDVNHPSRAQTGLVNAPMDSHKTPRSNQDPRLVKQLTSHGPQDVTQHPQFNSNRYPNESSDSKVRNPSPYSKPPLNVPQNNNPRRHSYFSPEPKSYAEYKRLKLKEQERLNQASKESPKAFDGSETFSRPPVEKEDTERNTTKKNLDPRHSGYKDPPLKQNAKTYPPPRTFERRKEFPNSKQTRHSDQAEGRTRGDSRDRRSHFEETKKEKEEKSRKVSEEKRHSTESEELVSPLEELYRSEDKPKTGRGYGIQYFKIPKKVSQGSSSSSKPNKSNQLAAKSEARSESGAQCEVDSSKKSAEVKKSEISQVNVAEPTKESKEETGKTPHQSEISPVDSTTVTEDVPSKSVEKAESNADCKKTDSNSTQNDATSGVTDYSEKTLKPDEVAENPGSVTAPTSTDSKTQEPAKADLKTDKTDNIDQAKVDAGAQMVTTNESKTVTEKVKKCEAEMVECDSSVESLNEQSSGKESGGTTTDKNTVVQKEEITQEFVEALIRKSFQSGEGKLLLAQVKLFEEFARKLNSKKLKTIQRIINSESGSSSYSSDASSEDDKRKRKGKKSEQKSKKRKKRGRRSRKHKFSSSSSSSENEETSEEDSCDKKEEKSQGKKNESLGSPSTSDENKSKSNETSGATTRGGRKRRNVEFRKHFGRRAKRKQKQNKLLEEILNEPPQPDASNDSNAGNTADIPAKESEPKSRPKTKGKGKTELDRLHEDIRSMFISAGVVTATGKRMCRILKQSGGNMNNLDIVKESARMVEEEKLKKVQARVSLRNTRQTNAGSSDNSRSQSADKGTKSQNENDEEQDPKLRLVPRITLQKVDLDNFGYGVKISDDCISFRRMRGRNKAIRGAGPFAKVESRKSLARNVFLARNKRKFERLKDSKRKKAYVGKKLMDIVQNLPLKMAKMKHLRICERKPEAEPIKKKKSPSGKTGKKSSGGQKNRLAKVELSNSELQFYAFEREKRAYICKLCSRVAKNITHHYKEAHPEHEVLISRLCLKEAESAKLESVKNEYDLAKTGKNLVKRRVKPLLFPSVTYHCRMCNFSKVADVNSFAAHVSTHTGELRFQCPECFLQLHSREGMKIHILKKHPKCRYDLYKRIIHLYPLTSAGGKLFGFLCSLCHFVQLCRSSLENHITRQHVSAEGARIIKINLSSRKWRNAHANNGSKEDGDEKKKTGDGESDSPEGESAKENVAETTDLLPSKKRRQRSADSSGCESDGSDIELHGSKRIFLNDSVEVLPVTGNTGQCRVKRSSVEEEINVEEDENADEDNLGSDTDTEDCIDLKGISSLKGSDIISSVETSEGESPAGNKLECLADCCRVKVGPLEAVLSSNSEVLYECYVKGCLFSTRVFDLFEKHIRISHWKTKWDGICQICNVVGDVARRRKDSFKLLTALNHLKLHERVRTSAGKLSAEDLIMELKLLSPSEECVVEDEESDNVENDVKENVTEAKDQGQEQTKTESSDTPYPPKPLLRVRNLLGDRLSTPKAEESEVVAINEEESNTGESSTDSSKMFTIENVRSLTEAPAGDSEIKIEQVCSLMELLSKPPPQLGSGGKTIIVRSCPTRKIAIRPEPSALPVDVGHLNVVRPPVVGHPVVLSPLSTASPIRIISTALSPKPKFTVKPIVVSADTVRLTSPNLVPVIRPALTPAVTTATILPITTTENCRVNPDVQPVPQKQAPQEGINPGGAEELIGSKISVDVEVITPPTRPKSPPGPSTTIHNVPKSSSSDADEPEEKDTISSQRFASSPNIGKKSVKDAKIYKEMLTKTKLCHLFKCMGIECSFTCNNENVFTQHIGLHEAQRRLKRNKGLKTIYLRSANKTTKAFYWQQCAYCCEVLSNTNKALSHHILEEHGHCMYQCAFCFYRAVSHCYVEIHQNLAHSQVLKTTPRVIYKCKPLKVPPSQAVALEKHGRKQSVRPYHCDQCGRKFYITHEFISHLASEHQSVTAYTCHICKNLCFKINRLINHYKLHSYSTYQCAYCLHGTETEKEMVFHLCNFHFSQPAVMYVRALADGQSGDEIQKPNKKKKQLSNQLDSLKVIIYESENPNLDCIVEADPDEDIPENISESSLDLSTIVAELGIYTDTGVTPLIKELAGIADKNPNHLTVKTLLPNAQFSSENENGGENCSVLISSGLSVPSDSNNEREMNIPLGQLPLEAVNVQHKETPPPPPANNGGSPDKNLKLNEIIVNLQHKDKSLGLPTEEEKAAQPMAVRSTAVHKLPPVVLSRSSALKNAYPSKSATVKKKPDESQGGENTEDEKTTDGCEKPNGENEVKAVDSKTEGESQGDANVNAGKPEEKETENSVEAISSDHPLITNVVSLSNSEFDKEESVGSDSIIISDICSLSTPSVEPKDNTNPPGVVINIKSAVNVGSVLKPPIIRVEDFSIEDDTDLQSEENTPKSKNETGEAADKEPENPEEPPSSPDIIILEDEKVKDIVTVTLDSDDEKDESGKKEKNPKKSPNSAAGDETIRKEMELLRNQIANETDSLLLDEPEAEKPTRELTLNIQPGKADEDPKEKTLLSPIEEAICSLNKKLQSESEEAQKREEEEKNEKTEESPTMDGSENPQPDRPRTRFGGRDKKKEGSESAEKSDGDESDKKDDPNKCKKFKDELIGKELFICGNEKCNFAADDDSTLKDHLYVCDLSRESSVLVCPHCSRQIKQFHPYLEHLKYHGEKKYHCGLCSFSSAVDTSVTRHVKQKHKCSVIKILPKESKEGHLLYYPKNHKIEKVYFDVNGYSPGDENKLPLQSVYQVNVKCAKCPYFTKVRSNMVRHLKIHLKSVETEGSVVVPSTAPTNPVPCLETKERMFDKMTNLAASSQLAQAKEKIAVENISPEEEAKLPQFVAEHMRYKCCLSDCNYITVDDGVLKHHIKALHDEINYYSCPHCRNTVHVDVRHVTLDKIGFHLKHHDSKLYKCPHCIFFHYQKNAVEKHTVEKHPDRRYFVQTVREPKPETTQEPPAVPSPSQDGGMRVWKCGLCEDFQTPSKSTLMDHQLKSHNSKSKYKCKLCSMKGNSYQAFSSHFSSKHPGEKVSYVKMYYSEKSGNVESQSGNSSGADSSNEHFDTTPLWQRGAPRIRHIRGILIEEEEIKTKKSKKASASESEADSADASNVTVNAFYCPLCTNKKKTFYTRSEYCFRTHLYQELNYQQFACILCGKMFVDRKDFEKHHSRVHTDKPQAVKQTKEDREIKFWVDQVIAKQQKQMEERKRKLSDAEASGSQGPPKKKKEV